MCDPQYLQKELENIEEVFLENGFDKKKIQNSLKPREIREKTGEEEEKRGLVMIPNIPEFTHKFNKIAAKHKFKTTNKADNKVRNLVAKAKTPLGEKNANVVYNILCKCKEYGYTGETYRMRGTRKKEHMNKVRLTKADIENGNIESAEKRMNDGDGGLARHSTECTLGIDWDQSKIVGQEQDTTQRKMLEGVETIKEKYKGRIPLNSYNQMEQWQSTIFSFLANSY